MAQGTSVEYVEHSFSPWWGCSRTSPGCARCFAADNARRWGQGSLWHLHGPRRVVSENQWRQPLKWNRDAQREGRLARVLCGTMCDVFEDHPAVGAARARLFGLIEATPWLAWCLFTKRPGNAGGMVPWGGAWPGNAWLIASVENQDWAGARIPVLLATAAPVRGLSVEPMLGPVDLAAAGAWPAGGGVDWVIVGGESGPRARPMHPQWARNLVAQCDAHSTPAWFKLLCTNSRLSGVGDPEQQRQANRDGENEKAELAGATPASECFPADLRYLDDESFPPAHVLSLYVVCVQAHQLRCALRARRHGPKRREHAAVSLRIAYSLDVELSHQAFDIDQVDRVQRLVGGEAVRVLFLRECRQRRRNAGGNSRSPLLFMTTKGMAGSEPGCQFWMSISSISETPSGAGCSSASRPGRLVLAA